MRLDRFIIFLLLFSLLTSGCHSSYDTATISPTISPISVKTPSKTSMALLLSTPHPTSPPVIPYPNLFTITPSVSFSKEHGDSFSPSISANGQWVAFISRANDLIEKPLSQCRSLNGQFEYCANVFVYDHDNGTINLVSISNDGTPANGNSGDPQISADGNWIVYTSEATNLIRGKTNSDRAIYVFNRKTGNTELVQAPGRKATISGDGRYIAFESSGSIFIYDHQTGETKLVGGELNFGQPGGDSLSPEISVDGQWLAFWSWDGNLVPGDKEVCALGDVSHSCGDVFLYNRETGTFTRIVVGAAYGLGMGEFQLSLSENGLWLAYNDRVFNRQTRRSEQLCGVGKIQCGGILSSDGHKVAFWTGTNYFTYDRSTGKVNQANIASDGKPGNGKYIDFTNSIEGESFTPGFSISADGQWVAFASTDSNLTADDIDQCNAPRFPPHNCYNVFMHNQVTRQTYLISKPSRK